MARLGTEDDSRLAHRFMFQQFEFYLTVAIKDVHRVIQPLPHDHDGSRRGKAVRAVEELHIASFELNRVIIADHPFVLKAEDVFDVKSIQRTVNIG